MKQSEIFNPLSKEQIMEKAPSVYSTTVADRTSNRYSFIPTNELLGVFNNEGWFVTDVKTQCPKNHKEEHGYHSLTLRHENFNMLDIVEDMIIPEILLNNNHMGLRSHSWLYGFLKFVCANGLVVAEEIASGRSAHRGVNLEELKRNLVNSISSFKSIGSDVMDYQTIQMTPIEKREFAFEAVMAKHSNIQVTKDLVDREMSVIDSYLKPRREHDDNNSLWSVFNVVQENLIKGGITSIIKKNEHVDSVENDMFNIMPEASGRQAKTKPIKDEKRRQELNQILWGLMIKYGSK